MANNAEIQDFLSDKALQQMEKLLKSLPLFKKGYEDLAGAMNKASIATEREFKASEALNKKINEGVSTQKDSIALSKEASRISSALVSTSAKLSKAYTDENKKLATKRLELQNTNKEIKRNIVIATAQDGSYKKIAASLSKNIQEWQKLSKAERENSTEGKRLISTIQSQDKVLKGLDAQIGRSQRHVGNYGKALFGVGKSLLGAFGIVGGIRAFTSVLSSTAKVVVNFDKSLTNLAAVTGKSTSEIEELKNQALELGSVTAFTSDQVVQLQLELAKLGFNDDEILKSTESIINFAVETGAEVPRAAALAGAALRSFDLDASEMGRVVSVLGVATTKSALDFSKLETQLPVVGAAANSMNVSLETTVARLGVLSDRGLDANTAATSLRNIFLELSKRGLSWNDAMEKINASQNKSTTALELFGKRGAVAALILADNAKSADVLTESLTDVSDQLQKMADTQLESVSGRVTLLKSAWDGLILSVENGNGVISNFTKNILSGLTNTLDLVKKYNDGDASFNDFFTVFLSGGKKMTSVLDDINNKIEETAETAEREQIKFEFDNVETTVKSVLDSLDEVGGRKDQIETLTKTIERLKVVGFSDLSDEVLPLTSKLRELNVAEYEYLETVRETEDAIKKENKATKDKGEISKVTLNAMQQLRQEQRALKESIELAALAGEDYNDFLVDYNNISSQLESVSSIFKPEDIDLSPFLDAQEEYYNKVAQNFKEINGARIAAQVAANQEEINEFENLQKILLATGKITQEQYNANLFNAQRDRITTELASLKEVIDATETTEKAKYEARKKYAELSISLNDIVADAEVRAAKETADKVKEINETKKAITTALVQGTADILNDINADSNERRQADLDRELERATTANEQETESLIQQRDAGLITEQQYALKKEQIDKDLAKKERAIKIKKFESDKKAKLIEATINIASGILQTLGSMPYPAAIPLIAALGISGAIQTALIASQPIPAFAEGVRNFEGGRALVGEAGHELLNMPGIGYAIADKPMVLDLPRGTDVFKNSETEKMLSQGQHAPRDNGLQEVGRKIDRLTDVMKKKPVTVINARKGKITDRRSTGFKEYYNRIAN